MPIRRKLATLRRLSWSDRAMMAEAVIALAIARLVIIFIPFRGYAAWLRKAPAGPPPSDVLVRRVRRAVEGGARNVPWNAVCLPQAMAAKALLARRGHPSSLHLGLRQKDSKLDAHAWLEAGGTIVVGARGMQEMTPIARFG